MRQNVPRSAQGNRRILRLFTWLLMGLFPTATPAFATDKNVVVVSLDGFPAYYLNAPQTSLPVLRGLMAQGVTAEGGMRVSNPSVTWPNHTTLMTGLRPERHGVLFNGLLERTGAGKPVVMKSGKTQAELVKVPLLFDLLKSAGMSSAAINWPCTRGSDAIADNFPDVPDQLEYTTPRLKQALLDRGLLPRFEDGNGIVRDEIWTEAARVVIAERMPRLLTLHLLNLDGTHHAFGPNTSPGYTAAALLDALLGRVLDSLDRAGVRDRTVVVVVSDHGFGAVKKTIRANVVLKRGGLLNFEGGTINSARAMSVAEGGTAMIYLTDPATAEQDAATVRRLFEKVEGVDSVVGPGEFARYGYPSPTNHPGMANLVIAAKEGYSFTDAANGDEVIGDNRGRTGVHGYLSTDSRMNGIFIAAGPGIRAGAKLGTIDNVDVAPTVARLLGVPLADVSGRILTEILDPAE